ncbi:hypothetical protein [Xanthomonas axonopodis]
MSKKPQAIRLSAKRQQKDRTWLIVGVIFAAVLVLFSVMRVTDSDMARAAAIQQVEIDTECSAKKLHPLVAYATGAGIEESIDAAVSGDISGCNR